MELSLLVLSPYFFHVTFTLSNRWWKCDIFLTVNVYAVGWNWKFSHWCKFYLSFPRSFAENICVKLKSSNCTRNDCKRWLYIFFSLYVAMVWRRHTSWFHNDGVHDGTRDKDNSIHVHVVWCLWYSSWRRVHNVVTRYLSVFAQSVSSFGRQKYSITVLILWHTHHAGPERGIRQNHCQNMDITRHNILYGNGATRSFSFIIG